MSPSGRSTKEHVMGDYPYSDKKDISKIHSSMHQIAPFGCYFNTSYSQILSLPMFEHEFTPLHTIMGHRQGEARVGARPLPPEKSSQILFPL